MDLPQPHVRTRGSFAAQRAKTGKGNAKQHLRSCLAALANIDLADENSVTNLEAYVGVGRSFKDLLQELYKQAGLRGDGLVADEKLFIQCLKQWSVPNSPDAPEGRTTPTLVRGVVKRTIQERSRVALSEIQTITKLRDAFPEWTFRIDIAKRSRDLDWRMKGPGGSLPFDIEMMSEEAVASVNEVIFHALYLSERFQRYGEDMGELPGADEYKLYTHVCTLLTALAAFSNKRALAVEELAEDRVVALEQQALDSLAALLHEVDLSVSHEQHIRGGLAGGRTEAAVVEEGRGSERQRHRGCAEVKRDLRYQYGGVAQCIGAMAAQTEQNWELDDMAEERVRKRRVTDEGDKAVLGGQEGAGPAPGVSRASSASTAEFNKGTVAARSETKFGVVTDWEHWFVLYMVAERGVDGQVTAQVTSSAEFIWRVEGRKGQLGLVRALCAVILPDISARDDQEWANRAALIKRAMDNHALMALRECKLGETKAASQLECMLLTEAEMRKLKEENAELKARLEALEASVPR